MTKPSTNNSAAPKLIQEQFGDAIIDAVRAFAVRDLETVSELEAK
jgi:cyanate lyase